MGDFLKYILDFNYIMYIVYGAEVMGPSNNHYTLIKVFPVPIHIIDIL